MAARDATVDLNGTLPLALLPAGSLYRQHALDTLSHAGRSWRVTAISDSIAGLQTAVYSGLAISVFPLCALNPSVRRLGEADGFPKLPVLEIVLQRKPSGVSRAAEVLGQYIVSELRNDFV